MRVLVVNAGSSSLKLRLLDPADAVVASRDLATTGGRFDERAVTSWLAELGDVDAVGHRVVHGGTAFRAPVRIDDEVEARLRALTDLAPLHQPKSLAGIETLRRTLPGVPQVACFDTAFHATLPPAAATYAIPIQWRDRLHVRRYGFHGLSHEYAAGRAAQLLARADARVVTCHLGAGASLAAVRGGVCVDTTMGFTPLEGLVMATRSGSVDPGLVLWLQQTAGLSAAEVVDALEHRSGLLALAGTADMRDVLAARDAGDAAATLAFEVYVHRLRAGIAAMTASVGGLDALLFTAGVGENAPAVRAAAADGLGFLGVGIDARRNVEAVPDIEITAPGAAVRSFVVAAREDVLIARQVRAVLDPSAGT